MTSQFLKSSQASRNYDVVIIGGAKIGAAVAWFLRCYKNYHGSVLVIERDPSFRFSSTARSNSCMRQQFSTEINVRISQFAAEFVNDFRAYLNHDPRVPEIHFQSFGYLYLADNEQAAASLKEAQRVQNHCGAATRLLQPDEIADSFPFYQLDDIVLGSHNAVNEGYYDGNTVFEWWRRVAGENGVDTLHDEVIGLTLNSDGSRVCSVQLASGISINCEQVVNAAGPRANQVARMAGIDIPVEPRKRFTYVFSAAKPLEVDLPLTIDPSGVYIRSDGGNYIAGCPPDTDPVVEPDDFEHDHSLWEAKVWPAIANRIPQFDAIKLINSWVGHYAFNTLDQNAIIGPHDEIKNFLFANGFSGHGFQQAPAVGRGIAELIVSGHYQTLDLSPFAYSRIPANQPFIEKAVI